MAAFPVNAINPLPRTPAKANKEHHFAMRPASDAMAAQAQARDNSGPQRQGASDRRSARQSLTSIRDSLIPSLMQFASGAQDEIDGLAFKSYRDALLREAGSQGVLEQTLLEQVALAHLASFQLQASAGMSKTAEEAGIYATAAAKLMGEVRRTIVAIKELRNPPARSNITIAATQQVNVSGQAAAVSPGEAAEKTDNRSELEDNHGPGAGRLREIFGEGSGRASEPATVRAAD